MSTPNSDSGGKSCESIGSYSFIHELCKGNSSSPDLAPDAKWWLNHHGLEKGYFLDPLNVLEADAKLLSASYVNGNAKASGETKLIEEYCNTDPKKDAAFCSDMPLKHFCSHCKSNGDSCLLGFESTINNHLLSNAHLLGLDSCNCLLLEQPEKLCSDLDSHWIGVKKMEPWWHAVEKDDLASLVSRSSSHHCDHPGVQSMHVENVSEDCIYCFDQFQEQMTNKETKVSHVVDRNQGTLDSLSTDTSLGAQGSVEPIQQESDQTFSSGDSLNTAKVDSSDVQEPYGDLNRAQLLEALCHSQTRAREAEKLAQTACDEKDHVINLFFQQASCLFAYRQWLRMLQLETLCLHLSSNDQLTSFATSSPLPWVRSKGVTLRKNRCRAAKKLGKQRCNVGKCAIAFAIGLSLAGAGLFVGWTIGWLFPAI